MADWRQERIKMTSTRLTISIDTALIYELQAKIQLDQKRKITIAEVIRLAIKKLAEDTL